MEENQYKDMNFIERLQYFMEKKGINDNQMTVNAGLSVGLIGKAKVSGKGMSSMNIEKILLAYPDLSADWLLTGAGSMLKDDLNGIKTIDEANSSTLPTTSMNPSIGTPYYDVDFIGGFDEVFNSQVNIPATNIVIRGFEKASLWCNVTGHSMEPKINHATSLPCTNAHSTTSNMAKSMQWCWIPSAPLKSSAGRRIRTSCASSPSTPMITMNRNSTNHASSMSLK